MLGGRNSNPEGFASAQELEGLMSDMQVLWRYGYDRRVLEELRSLCRRFPKDLLLLRRFAEFCQQVGRPAQAAEFLFVLAAKLYRRRELDAMLATLKQVLELVPGHALAQRLLTMLGRPMNGIGPHQGA